MPIAVMRLRSADPPVYCCATCYDVAIRHDPAIAAYFGVEPAPLRFTLSDRFHRPTLTLTQCGACERSVYRLLEEVDALGRLHAAMRSGESLRDVHVALRAQPSWLFHGHTTAFPTALAALVAQHPRLDAERIRAHVESIHGIPTPEQIVRTIRVAIGGVSPRTTTETANDATTDDDPPIPNEVWESIEPLELPEPTLG